ncbi:SpoIIE family protein phosphatase [Lentzea sp.]|uniref:SpoIIE family protein phosphatase n=1 Tax=Lentzea sp. TaxID=56099 RepID=UPI002ED5792A
MTVSGADGDGPHSAAGDAGVVRRVFDLMPLLVIAFEGPELRITAATGVFRAWTGRPAVVGTTLREAFAETAGQQTLETVERVYATGEPESLRDYRFQFDRTDAGDRVELFADWNITPVFSAGAEVTGLVIDIVDVTGRVRERQGAQQRAVEAERRYAEARDVIDALQREMLPSSVPVLPRAQVAASYLLAQADTAAGGDWFDAVPLPGGRLGLVVGDVVGHGLAASATMGQLRVVLSERLAVTADVVEALRSADAASRRIPGARSATVCVAVLDPATGVVDYASAGHPPPLVVAGGEARFLPGSGDPPLGVHGEWRTPTVQRESLVTGDVLLLYTDGVLERPRRTLAEATVELLQVAADVVADRVLRDHLPLAADRLCTQTVELLARVTGHSDDITLLAVQLVTPPPAFHRVYRAAPESLAPLRADLSCWVDGLRIGAHDADALQHAVVELATNAVEHAYIDSAADHEFVITGELTDRGEVEVRVSDDGRWREPVPSPDRGLGLKITADMVDHFRVEHDGHGTTSVLLHRVGRPARLLTADDLTFGFALAPPEPDQPLLIEDRSAAGPRLRVTGPVDAHTAKKFEYAVTVAGSTGTRSLTVDLGAVTHLASAGVSVLHRLTTRHRDNGTELRLVAPVATSADVVMTLVGLAHDTDAEG